MKKKLIIASVIGAAIVGLSGCSGGATNSGSDDGTTETVTETTTVKESTESTTAATTTTIKETTKEPETSVTESATPETETTTSTEETTKSAESGDYSLVINKALDGFTKIGEMEYDGPDAMYTYSVLNDTTKHEIEDRLDSEAASMKDGTTGVKGDVMFSMGRTDTGYCVTAYRYMAPGDNVSSFAGVQYLSEGEVSADTVIQLLSDEYISFER